MIPMQPTEGRHSGAALIAIVLAGFMLLTLLCAVAFTISARTMRVEEWQTLHDKKVRLNYLACSSANAVIEALSADKSCFGTDPADKTGKADITDSDYGLSASVEISITGDVNSRVLITSKASGADTLSSTVTADFDTLNKKVLSWGGIE